MTNIEYIARDIIRSKWVYIAAVCIAAIIMGLRLLTIPSYRYCDVAMTIDAKPEQPSLFEKSYGNQRNKIMMILHSHEFRQQFIGREGGKINEKNISQRVKIYETPQYSMAVHVYTNDTTEGKRLLQKALDYAQSQYNNYYSSKLDALIKSVEGNVDVYSILWKFDVVEQPCVYSTPKISLIFKHSFVALLIGLCVAMTGKALIAGLKRNDEGMGK